MSSIRELLAAIARTPDCVVRPQSGLPTVDGTRGGSHTVPGDVLEFYALCGGVELYAESDYGIEIVRPDQVTLASDRFFRGLREEQIATSIGHECWDWYLIAKASNTQYIAIDFNPGRLGRCYDAFWETYPDLDEVVATSFTDLLRRLYENGGEYWHWLDPGLTHPSLLEGCGSDRSAHTNICGTVCALTRGTMSDADFGDLRFVIMVVAAFLMGIAGSLVQLNAFLPH